LISLLVSCTHNSARSQMAEGWLRYLAQQAGLDCLVDSAGNQKTQVKAPAIEVMHEVGIDLSSHWSKTIAELPHPNSYDAVITVCDSARDECPYLAGVSRRYHVSLADPSGQPLDTWRQSRNQVGQVMQVLIDHLCLSQWPEPDALERAK
jgi:arsenate reductase